MGEEKTKLFPEISNYGVPHQITGHKKWGTNFMLPKTKK